VPDQATLEAIATELSTAVPGAILGTTHFHGRATLLAEPGHAHDVIERLHGKGYNFLASLHGCDYYPEEPRLGVLYELLDMREAERIAVKARVHLDSPHVKTVTDLWPGANHPEREVYDMFGVVFEGHPDLRRILMPEDYEGHPQRRDFPIGGEPVLFTHNEQTSYGQWQ
jgi:NADH-quinone oxidoreductase subunit C